jgi:hypothetical protein
MDETFVTVDLTEFEYDELLEWLGEQEIATGLSKLYDKLIAAAESIDEEVEEEAADE